MKIQEASAIFYRHLTNRAFYYNIDVRKNESRVEMLKENVTLPAYPVTADMWDLLSRESRPIVVYGMGNGADKLIKRFEKYGIEIADFFASDGFVRGHSFHGKRVKSFSEIRSEYSDFVIVLSFASNREEVLSMLLDIDAHYDMFIPDMPVAGDEYFDREFYNFHYAEIVEAYNALSDEESKNIFAATVNYKLSGRMKYLLLARSTRDEIYSLLPCENIHTIIDAGAYNGDTAREAKNYFHNLKKIYAIEPDNKNFKKLARYCEAEMEIQIVPINSAAWCENTDGSFMNSGNRNSSVSSTASFEHKDTGISLVRLDSITNEKIDYIKYDVEGAEREALVGSDAIIRAYSPAMLVSLYHRSADVFEIVNTLKESYPEYDMYLRRLWCVPAWELDLILVRKDKND